MSLRIAKKVLLEESVALRTLARQLGSSFSRAVKLIKRARGRVVVLGMGKPGYIAQKLSASLASTGTPSISFHAADAMHGDLGRIHRGDVLLLLSKSGQTEEIVRLLPALKNLGCKIIAITANMDSILARAADVKLSIPVQNEAGPMGIVPTTSTSCMLALGDALTMALVHERKFRSHDFAQLHPGGMLGKMLTLRVKSVMRTGRRCPIVRPNATLKTALLRITSARAGAVSICNQKKRCLGIFTDGDLRRRFMQIQRHPQWPISKLMTHKPLTVCSEDLATEALRILKKRNIDELPVVDRRGRQVGLLDIQDLLNEGFAR